MPAARLKLALALALTVLLARKWAARRRRVVPKSKTVGIIGAGCGGIIAAHRMLEAGFPIESISLYEMDHEFGGTWLKNTYPDCGCDVFSHAYSFSWAPKTDWSRLFSKQPEILAYVIETAENLGLRPRTLFNCKVESAHFNGKQWDVLIKRADGSMQIATHTFLIAATGQLNVPNIPQQLDPKAFTGPSFHTAEWDHSVDLAGKRVACIGTGASAIQALPIIAPVVKQLDVFQRSPGWIVGKNDYEYSSITKAAFKWLPLVHRLYRYYFFAYMDYAWLMMIPNSAKEPSWTNRLLTDFVRQYRPPMPVPELESKDTLGCKRLLITDLWFPMFAKENVKLHTHAVTKLIANGLETADGTKHESDVIIFATGFRTNDFVPGVRITATGRETTLKDTWGEAPAAYKTSMVPGFPNFCVMYGPNSNVNSTSIIAMMECTMDHFGQLVEKALDDNLDSFAVKQGAHDAYAARMQKRLSTTAFNADCDSWYKNNPAKKIVNNWWGGLVHYALETHHVVWSDFELL